MLKALFVAASIGTLSLAASGAALAADVVLRLHQMLPPQATIPAKALTPWAEKVAKDSGGRIKVEMYSAMQLGGKPADLVDQAKDGVVDLIWTVIGYTPGRFPKSEAFELPFLATNATASSQAFHEFYEKHLKDEFKDYKVIAMHVHGPGIIHTRTKTVEKLADMQGLKLRGTSRVVNNMLAALGATPVGLPVPAIPEALSKGVIDGTVVPWEVTPSVKIAELAPKHTAFSGKYGLYTATFLFGMNKDSYNNLPADLKKVIDDNSGMATAKLFGEAMDTGDVVSKQIADKAGNVTVTLDAAETARWHDAAQKVINDWVKEMDGKGLNGTALYTDAKALIAKYSN